MASAAISIIALEPSTKLASIFGFIFLRLASSVSIFGVSCGRIGLFFPLPAQTTSKARSRANSTSLSASAGSSPRHSVYTAPTWPASRASSQPTVMSVSTLSRPTCLPASRLRNAICAPISGTPVASMTMSTGSAVSSCGSVVATVRPSRIRLPSWS